MSGSYRRNSMQQNRSTGKHNPVRKASCKSMDMNLQEMMEERARSGWNPYEGEEETLEVWEEPYESRGTEEVRRYGRTSGEMPAGWNRASLPEEQRGWRGEALAEAPGRWNDGALAETPGRWHGGTTGETPEQNGMPMQQPYFAWPEYRQVLEEQREMESDLRRLQSMYPQAARTLLPYIEEECDKMEYEGSSMYAEYPDQTTIQNIQDRIYNQVRENFDVEEPEGPDDLVSLQYRRGERDPRGRNWLDNLIRVLLLQEMHHRRCRHRGCRRWR